jgi:hypothetical protein
MVQKRLVVLEQRFKRGERSAVLEALDLWLETFEGPPRWIADGFFDLLSQWKLRAVPTLDAAFGVHSSTAHLPAQHRREILRARIMYEISRLSQQGMTRDIRLFEHVGERVGTSSGYVLKVYRDKGSTVWKKMLGLKRAKRPKTVLRKSHFS